VIDANVPTVLELLSVETPDTDLYRCRAMYANPMAYTEVSPRAASHPVPPREFLIAMATTAAEGLGLG
jgi:hypothetical protein